MIAPLSTTPSPAGVSGTTVRRLASNATNKDSEADRSTPNAAATQYTRSPSDAQMMAVEITTGNHPWREKEEITPSCRRSKGAMNRSGTNRRMTDG